MVRLWGGIYFVEVVLFTGFSGFFLPAPTKSIEDVVGGDTLRQLAGGKEPPKNYPTTMKTQIHPESHHSGIPRAASSRQQRDCNTEFHRTSIIELHTTNSSSQKRSIKEAEANKKSLTNNGKTNKHSPKRK